MKIEYTPLWKVNKVNPPVLELFETIKRELYARQYREERALPECMQPDLGGES